MTLALALLAYIAITAIAVALIHGASKARTDRMLGEEIDSVTGEKG